MYEMLTQTGSEIKALRMRFTRATSVTIDWKVSIDPRRVQIFAPIEAKSKLQFDMTWIGCLFLRASGRVYPVEFDVNVSLRLMWSHFAENVAVSVLLS